MKTVLFAACALICVPALAQDAPHGPPPGPTDGSPQPAPPGMRVDTRAEAIERVQRAFAVIDANHDGIVDQAEIAGAEARMQAAARAANGGAAPAGPDGNGGGGVARMLGRADADKDGRVTLQEVTDNSARRFDLLDTNHDGKVTPEERAAAPQPTPGH